MTYLDLAEQLVKHLEGCRLYGYLDSRGIPTIGYGHTGPDVHLNLTITQAQADAYLAQDLAAANRRLVAVAPLDELNDHQKAALVSFVFNAGAEAGWTIWRVLRTGHPEPVPAQLLRFIYADHKPLIGLINRRKAEVAFFNTPDA